MEEEAPQTKYWRAILLASEERKNEQRTRKERHTTQYVSIKDVCRLSCMECRRLTKNNVFIVFKGFRRDNKDSAMNCVCLWNNFEEETHWPVLPEAVSPVMTIAWSSWFSDIDLNAYSVKAYLYVVVVTSNGRKMEMNHLSECMSDSNSLDKMSVMSPQWITCTFRQSLLLSYYVWCHNNNLCQNVSVVFHDWYWAKRFTYTWGGKSNTL